MKALSEALNRRAGGKHEVRARVDAAREDLPEWRDFPECCREARADTDTVTNTSRPEEVHDVSQNRPIADAKYFPNR